MPQAAPNVKGVPQGDREHRTLVQRCQDFVDRHPRTGWYIAIMATLNVILNILDLFH